MGTYSVVSLFCEDIRVEKTEQRTLIGIFKDALNVQALPIVLARLSVFTRLSADIDFSIEELKVRLLDVGGETIADSAVSSELIKRSREEARKQDNPAYGFMMQIQIGMFSLEREGIRRAVCTINGQDIESGFLNIRLIPPATDD